jgi:hypothetical protein
VDNYNFQPADGGRLFVALICTAFTSSVSLAVRFAPSCILKLARFILPGYAGIFFALGRHLKM